MTIKLSSRLQTILDFIPPGRALYDVGSDHGYLPLAAYRSGRCPKVTAVENKPGPYERLKANLADVSKIEVVLADGLEAYDPASGATVAMAGLGGATICGILERFRAGSPIPCLVLEPQSDQGALRRFLKERGYRISAETYVTERGKFYPVIRYEPGTEELDEIELLYGPLALRQGDARLGELLMRTAERLTNIASPRAQRNLELVKEALKRWKK